MINPAHDVSSIVMASAIGVSVLWPLSVMANSACLLGCIKGNSCEVEGPPGKKLSLSETELRSQKACDELVVTSDDKVLMRYRSGGKWFQPSPPPGKDAQLKTFFVSAPPDPCSVPTPICLQQRMNGKTSSKAGHGIDDQVAMPAGTN